MGDTGKADMLSGRLAFATRHVDLMAAGMSAPLALCADGITTKRGKTCPDGGSSSGSACDHHDGFVTLLLIRHFYFFPSPKKREFDLKCQTNPSLETALLQMITSKSPSRT